MSYGMKLRCKINRDREICTAVIKIDFDVGLGWRHQYLFHNTLLAISPLSTRTRLRSRRRLASSRFRPRLLGRRNAGNRWCLGRVLRWRGDVLLLPLYRVLLGCWMVSKLLKQFLRQGVHVRRATLDLRRSFRVTVHLESFSRLGLWFGGEGVVGESPVTVRLSQVLGSLVGRRRLQHCLLWAAEENGRVLRNTLTDSLKPCLLSPLLCQVWVSWKSIRPDLLVTCFDSLSFLARFFRRPRFSDRKRCLRRLTQSMDDSPLVTTVLR
mmetsp:Transcript_16314/g.39062  ORF Transcript_16314/g.39062 Transcript_16314/m.39062 type:complete len:267 (+) Transcript_16314:283-1083(+)